MPWPCSVRSHPVDAPFEPVTGSLTTKSLCACRLIDGGHFEGPRSRGGCNALPMTPPIGFSWNGSNWACHTRGVVHGQHTYTCHFSGHVCIIVGNIACLSAFGMHVPISTGSQLEQNAVRRGRDGNIKEDRCRPIATCKRVCATHGSKGARYCGSAVKPTHILHTYIVYSSSRVGSGEADARPGWLSLRKLGGVRMSHDPRRTSCPTPNNNHQSMRTG